ncbi:hypothetical protein ABE28_013490 [Peribacillus muralis]|uniref:Uncharacterized protein n=1 Tax=Peribacillus muralis TaxID=264697 RepID=A0A1B3XQ77_9BACI|nr:hypothetical protein [Peribacillus muralis]AOH55367.1 hypothetical protein ABE28_013490 [Peribacillus muralis]
MTAFNAFIESEPGLEVVVRNGHMIVMNHNHEEAVFEENVLQPFEMKILNQEKKTLKGTV